jgi:hypothetical protein
MRGHCGRDRMVVGFTITCAINAYHHWSCEFKPRSWGGVLYTKLCDKVCQWPATGQWFSLGTLVSSTNKSDCHNITEIFNWYLCVSAKHAVLRSKSKDWFTQNQKNVFEWTGGTCLTADCRFSELALCKSISAYRSSIKRTSSLSSHQNVTCSRRDIAEKLLIWHQTIISDSLSSMNTFVLLHE